ncbi:hypothetical protein [Mycobacterium sp. IS-1556]|uniref:hypothetical protein n=1 Tax=Mycobacterium sp. IS-1556 TaxID=1772276 RepID=UPI0012E39249|nr:hypothetical protein [Mycobacterium sp. IS-1556]
MSESERTSAARYGPATFVAALGNTLVVGLATWYFIPWFALVVFTIPLLLLDFAIGVVFVTRPGAMGQVGRGMLIGLIAAPLTLLLFLPGLLLVQAINLV